MSRKPSHLTSIAQVKALGSAIRQTVWNLITLLQPVAARDLQKLMGLERHALYYHLRVLEECELISKKQDNQHAVTYETFAEDILIQPSDSPEWQEVLTDVVRSSMRRLSNRLESSIKQTGAQVENRKYLSGSMTLFLNDQGRQLLRNRLNQLWDDLEEFQDVPKKDEKPYYFAFGFAPESYGQD
ncbi:MAG: hypothetical protein QM477_06025 [Planctomycetota bacterium]